LVFTVSLAAFAGSASASEEGSTFDFHVADAVIQSGTGLAQTGAVAEASNHDQVRVSGRGKLNVKSKKASGSGSFVHTHASGAVQGFGTWTARSVRSATIYPCGEPGVPSNFCGGLVSLNVRINGTSTTAGAVSFDAVLTIDCEINPPTPGVEGIKLDIPGHINFNTTIFSPGGLTVFVAKGGGNDD